MKREHRHRLAVVSHRGQEIFNVAIMGYRNSPAYVQRRIDTILRPCRSYARAYVDDIVMTGYLQHYVVLYGQIFEPLQLRNMALNKALRRYRDIAADGSK